MTHTDQLNRNISLEAFPQRIISTVPSQTELLYDLELGKEVIGITKFCVYPEDWFRSKERIGGTKNLHLGSIEALKPDLIIANKEENTKEDIEWLAQRYPVWISDVTTLENAKTMIQSVAAMTDRVSLGDNLLKNIRNSFSDLSVRIKEKPRRRAAYLIWKNPYMTIGGDTFINDMLDKAGYENVFYNQRRYPEVDIMTLRTLEVDTLLLSSEPFPFRDADIIELKKELSHMDIRLVDGEYFSWYGSRLKYAPEYFLKLREGFF